ncbi:MAG: hypothetical protein M5U28_01480 [Sandaracinaceae bacterium]|nr:hypothetical protein [Sandaracinaceae bacterium]
MLEPATREITRELMALRDRFALDPGPPHVFAPCLRDGPCPMLPRERDWCHDQLPFVLPEPLARVAREAGLRWERLTYAYLTLRNDERRLWDLAARDPRAHRVVGGPVESKGKSEGSAAARAGWSACAGSSASARGRAWPSTARREGRCSASRRARARCGPGPTCRSSGCSAETAARGLRHSPARGSAPSGRTPRVAPGSAGRVERRMSVDRALHIGSAP